MGCAGFWTAGGMRSNLPPVYGAPALRIATPLFCFLFPLRVQQEIAGGSFHSKSASVRSTIRTIRTPLHSSPSSRVLSVGLAPQCVQMAVPERSFGQAPR